MSHGDPVSYRALLRVALTSIGMLVTAVLGFYLHAEEKHETRQDETLEAHDERLRDADGERTVMQRDLEQIAKGVQWLVNRREEELGSENLPEPPPVVDPDSARSGP